MAKGEFTVGKGCLSVFFGILAVILFLTIGLPLLGVGGLLSLIGFGIADNVKNASPSEPSPSAIHTDIIATPEPMLPASKPDTITLEAPTQVTVRYGTITIPAGTTLHVVSRDSTSVKVRYDNEVITLPKIEPNKVKD